jgi:hypothetical protein
MIWISFEYYDDWNVLPATRVRSLMETLGMFDAKL